jgi:hypothetical protein
MHFERMASTYAAARPPYPDIAEVAGAAVDELGGRVTEHYQSVLHLLVRSAEHAPGPPRSGS